LNYTEVHREGTELHREKRMDLEDKLFILVKPMNPKTSVVLSAFSVYLCVIKKLLTNSTALAK
jgi:hypothetical protein